ncbi:NAD(+) diphosphatase [Fodinicola feengrottensis]|uniref:NAD(+) diphosphatase n=1 Tax=Fodinicola feengrottensis TaxID=435914 RepID=UPI002441A211|nr:NAD(+) diphosphatase [Fodinicola feengrottensis]
MNRAAHRRRDTQWLADAWKRAQVLVVDADGRALVDTSTRPYELILVAADAAPDGDRLFLGEDDEQVYFAVRGELPAETGGPEPHTVRAVGASLGARDAGLFVEAVALANWHDNIAYDPVTGAPTQARDGGWVRVSEGGAQIFPRTDPAMIVLVHDGVAGPAGRALLGRQAEWPPGRYSTLAGFVEPGESAEAAVVREVAEETGVAVTDVRYVGSQPWPFPASLMLGFSALADPAQPIRRVDEELEDARWFTRDEIRAQRDANRVMPMTTSIAYYLISNWLDGII